MLSNNEKQTLVYPPLGIKIQNLTIVLEILSNPLLPLPPPPGVLFLITL